MKSFVNPNIGAMLITFFLIIHVRQQFTFFLILMEDYINIIFSPFVVVKFSFDLFLELLTPTY
jgi:hypothetical protein